MSTGLTPVLVCLCQLTFSAAERTYRLFPGPCDSAGHHRKIVERKISPLHLIGQRAEQHSVESFLLIGLLREIGLFQYFFYLTLEEHLITSGRFTVRIFIRPFLFYTTPSEPSFNNRYGNTSESSLKISERNLKKQLKNDSGNDSIPLMIEARKRRYMAEPVGT